MADLSNWLKASKHPSSDSCATVITSVLASTPDKCWLKASKHPSSDSCATVITSVLASTPDKWLANPNYVKTPFAAAAAVASLEAVPQPPDAKISRQSHPPTVFNKNRQHHSNTSNFANLSLRLNEPGVKEEEHLMQSAQQFRTISESVEETLNRLATLFEDKTISQPIKKLADTNALKHYPFSAAVDNVFDWNVQPKHCADTATAAVVPMPMDTLSTVVVVVDDPAVDQQQQQQQLKVKTPLALPTDPSYWLKQYPPPKQNRPMNEMAEDLCCWESVLGWKSILEKIHGSGEDGWLAPSSRAIKNEAGTD
uniref:Mediator of RNA polymerase II transcription subunit 13 n=1 Tax=Globodera pallida TaxID=36090 RepID=A0A183C831_GLOPA